MTNFIERLKVNSFIDSDPVSLAYSKHLILKKDYLDHYKSDAISQAFNLISFFEQCYPGVIIDNPLLREKSSKSIFDKIMSLEIERLGKLYLVEADIPDKLHKLEKDKLGDFFPVNLSLLELLVSKRIDENLSTQESINAKKSLHSLLFDDIKDVNISNIAKNLFDKRKLSKNSKTSLLRILIAKVKSSDLHNKDEILQGLDEKYGKTAAELSGIPEDDIIGYDSILSMEDSSYNLNNEIFDNRYSSKLERLIYEQEFLRCKDLIGMQIIVSSIPDNFTSSNPEIAELLAMRKQITDKNSCEYKRIDQACMTAICEDFIDKLTTSPEWLKKTNTRIVRDSVKHKRKTNGYVAEHIKFELGGNPDHTLEFQVKSKYVDILSHAPGTAAHSARIGKERVLPTLLQDGSADVTKVSDEDLKRFRRELVYRLPKFVEFEKDSTGKYRSYYFSTLENCFKFYDVIFNKDHDSALKLSYLVNKIEKSEKEQDLSR